MRQSGFRAVQTVAPRSMRAWFQTPAPRRETQALAAAWIRRPRPRGDFSLRARSRETTRSTFPSMAASGPSKAMDEMAAAV
jgi:hypothetical protein